MENVGIRSKQCLSANKMWSGISQEVTRGIVLCGVLTLFSGIAISLAFDSRVALTIAILTSWYGQCFSITLNACYIQ